MPGGAGPQAGPKGAGPLFPKPWEDPPHGSTLGLYNLHHRNIRVQNWGLYVLHPPRPLLFLSQGTSKLAFIRDDSPNFLGFRILDPPLELLDLRARSTKRALVVIGYRPCEPGDWCELVGCWGGRVNRAAKQPAIIGAMQEEGV